MNLDDVLPRFLEEPGGHVVMDTDFRVVEVGPEYLRLTNSQRENLIGKVYLNTRTEPNMKRHMAMMENLRVAMAQVLKTGQTVKLPVFRADIVPHDGGRPIEKWWRSAMIPVRDGSKVEYVVYRVEDVTAEMISLRMVSSLRRSNYILYGLVCLLVGLIAWQLVRVIDQNQRDRINTIRATCQDQNRRNVNTINKLKSIDGAYEKKHPNQAAQIKSSTQQTIELINALAPYHNCHQVVEQAIGQ